MIRDLLNPGSGYLDLREDQKGVQVAGLSEHSAASTDQVSNTLLWRAVIESGSIDVDGLING